MKKRQLKKQKQKNKYEKIPNTIVHPLSTPHNIRKITLPIINNNIIFDNF